MTTGKTVPDDSKGPELFAALLLVAGLGLAGYGGYTHFSVAARASTGRCDGCAPWHPLFVVAPLVVGVALAVGGGYLLYRNIW